MQITRSRALTAALGLTVGALVLTGCTAEPAPAPEPEVEVEVVEEETPTPEAPVATGDGTLAPWAAPYQTVGEVISTISIGDITVEVYQVDVVPATKTGNFVDPSDNKPIIDVGTDVVFLQYVVTNNGAPIDLGSSLVSVSPRYDDWPFLQGMDSITDFALTESLGLNTTELAPGGFSDSGVYTLGTGESYAEAANFRYQSGSPITFNVTVIPVDADGDLIHDERQEVDGTGVTP